MTHTHTHAHTHTRTHTHTHTHTHTLLRHHARGPPRLSRSPVGSEPRSPMRSRRHSNLNPGSPTGPSGAPPEGILGVVGGFPTAGIPRSAPTLKHTLAAGDGSLCLCVSVSVSLSLCLSVSVCLSLSLSVSLFISLTHATPAPAPYTHTPASASISCLSLGQGDLSLHSLIRCLAHVLEVDSIPTITSFSTRCVVYQVQIRKPAQGV